MRSNSGNEVDVVETLRASCNGRIYIIEGTEVDTGLRTEPWKRSRTEGKRGVVPNNGALIGCIVSSNREVK